MNNLRGGILKDLILYTQPDFRNIKNSKINLSNSQLSIVYGINASGKSSFLEAIYLNKQNHDSLKNRKINLIYVPMNRIGKELALHKPNIDNLIQNKLVSFDDYVFSGLDMVNDTTITEGFSASRTYLIEVLNYRNDVENLINELFESVFFNIDNFNNNSDGYKSIYNIISTIIYKSIVEESIDSIFMLEYCSKIHSVVLIDEIDSYIHQKIQFKILAFLTSLFPNCKFLLTTHSPIILKSLPATDQRFIIKDGLLYERSSVFFENLDIIVQDEFDVSFSRNKSSILMDFMNHYFENPQIVNNLSADKKNIILLELHRESNKKELYSSRQIEWIRYLIGVLS